MEEEIWKDEAGDIVLKEYGTPHNNMIGALTTIILEHWFRTEKEIVEKHSIILMNMKWKKMLHYDDFHREWTQRIYEVKDSKNTLCKQVYLAYLPSKFVEYLKAQDIFKQNWIIHMGRNILHNYKKFRRIVHKHENQ